MEENNVLSFEELWSQYKIFFSEVFAKNSLRWSAVFDVEKPQVSDIKHALKKIECVFLTLYFLPAGYNMAGNKATPWIQRGTTYLWASAEKEISIYFKPRYFPYCLVEYSGHPHRGQVSWRKHNQWEVELSLRPSALTMQLSSSIFKMSLWKLEHLITEMS